MKHSFVKRVLSVFLSLVMLAGVCTALPLSAGAEAALDLRVTPFGSDKTEVRAWYNSTSKSYDLFLPADCNRAALTVAFSGGETLTAGKTALKNGDVTNAFKADKLTVSVGGEKYTVRCFVSANIPSVYIQTESGSLNYIHANKENKEKAVITTVEGGQITLDGAALKQIKGRGNSTWGKPKKPYNIKFDKKTALLGMPKAKKWSFLASYNDRSLLRNPIAFELASRLGLPFTSEYRFVDLYINGEYLGNYIVCESVEVGDNRVEIPDLDDANEEANPGTDIESLPRGSAGGNDPGSRKWIQVPNDPEDITGGYLLETEFQDRFYPEISGFESNGGQNITIKTPEYASKNEVDYIADYYQAFEDAVMSDTGYNAQGKHFTEYIDLASFAKNYVVQELMFNVDGCQSSFYMYKDAGDAKLVASPVWDFDLSLGKDGELTPKDEIDTGNPALWYINMLYYCRNDCGGETHDYCGTLLRNLFMMQKDFRDAANEQWAALMPIQKEVVAQMRTIGEQLTPSAVMDILRWRQLEGMLTTDLIKASYQSQVDQALNFVTKRADALTKGFAPNAAFLYYESNGGNGRRVEPNVHVKGDIVLVKGEGMEDYRVLAPDSENDAFSHWNTKPDGSGKSYSSGATLKLPAGVTILYAQWRSKTATDSFKDRLAAVFYDILDAIGRLWNKFTALFS